MKMRLAWLIPALALGALGLTHAAGPDARTATPKAPPLRPVGECMVSRQVLDWGVVDDRRVVVRTLGGRYYDVQLQHGCRDMLRRPFLSFHDGPLQLPLGSGRGWRHGVGRDPVTSDGRICGDLGDAVLPRGGLLNGTEIPCRIASVRRIDKRAYDGVFGVDSASANRMLDRSPSLVPRR